VTHDIRQIQGPNHPAVVEVNRFLIPLGIIVLMVALLALGLSLDPRKLPSALIDKPVPTFNLPLLHQEGIFLSSSELEGQVTLLNVWASWCVNCRIEHPLLMEVSRDQSLNIYGLNYKDTSFDGLKWLGFYGDPYKLSIVDESGRTGIDFGVYAVPETFVIDGQGKIRHKHIGAMTREDWDETVLPIVRQLESEL